MAISSIKGGEVGSVTYIPNSRVSALVGSCYRNNGIVVLNLNVTGSSPELSNWVKIGTVSFPPKNNIVMNVVVDSNESSAIKIRLRVNTAGDVHMFYGGAGTFYANLTYPSA